MAFSGLGAGTVGDPYQITSWPQFQEIGSYASSYFKLMNDINANGGDISAVTFTGNLDGQNYKLSNIFRLFAVTGGTIKNVKIGWFSTNTGYYLFNGITNSSFENVFIENTNTSGNLILSFGVSGSNFTNFTFFSSIALELSHYSKAFSTNIFNNCTFQNPIKIWYQGNLLACTFNQSKILVVNNLQNSISTYRMYGCYFNSCLILGDWATTYSSSVVADRNHFDSCGLITNLTITKTGALTQGYDYGLIKSPGIQAEYNKCYFGGNINIHHQNYTENSSFQYRLFDSIIYGAMTDCHIGININLTFDVASNYLKYYVCPDAYNSGAITRLFINGNTSGQTPVGQKNASKTFVNSFIDQTKYNKGLPLGTNSTLLTTAQTYNAANFINFDFTNVWQITEGSAAPTLRNVIYSESDYLLGAVLNSISVARDSAHIEKLSINTARALPSGSTLKVYVSTDLATLVSPSNLVNTTTISSSLIQADLPVNEGTFYTKVIYTKDDYSQEFSLSDFHYEAAQVSTTIINIVAPNYMTPTGLMYLHGSILLNGYLYGSARGSYNGTDNGQSLIKLKADDYSVYSMVKFYANKTAQTDNYGGMDQIVYCKGFLWVLSGGYLIRINPTDLDYMVFARIDVTQWNQPIGTDGEFLFVTTNTAVYKVNAALLLDSFASYGYTGTAPVVFPTGAILGNCTIIQLDNSIPAFSHSICADSNFIYLAITSNNQLDGYDNGINMYHVQKIDKNSMTTAGDVVIPKCTDDMCQNANYLFLAPEMSNITPDIFGSEYGLIAIKKSTLELKYLKALHKDFKTDSENDRQCYGVFLFGNKIIVQLVNSKKSVVVNIDNVENWGSTFPIGGATEAVYKFQKNGVDVAYPPNELVIDSNNWVHISTWGTPGDIMKFPLSSMPGINLTPIVQTMLISNDSGNITVAGGILNEGQSAMTAGGFKYGTNPASLTNDLPVTPFSYNFQASINLPAGIYYFQAYGTNSQGTTLGNVIMVINFNCFSLSYSDTVALLDLINKHNGCSIRCVQDAPGIADFTTGTVTDQDGNTYKTIVISQKRWMIENLKATKFRNGDSIPKITDAQQWASDNTGAYCTFKNKPL